MTKEIIDITTLSQKRMLTEKEAMFYTSLGRNLTRQLGKDINCVVHYGPKRIMYDRKLIDEYFDSLSERPKTAQ